MAEIIEEIYDNDEYLIVNVGKEEVKVQQSFSYGDADENSICTEMNNQSHHEKIEYIEVSKHFLFLDK